jgi:hypothetical protein
VKAIAQNQYLLLVQTKPDMEPMPNNIPSFVKVLEDQDLQNARFYGASLADLQHFINQVPRDAHLDKYRAAAAKRSLPSTRNTLHDSHQVFEAIFEEVDEEEEKTSKQADPSNTVHVTNNQQLTERDDVDEQLNIAWQYKLSIQNARYRKSNTLKEDSEVLKNHSDIYCHSYDLSGSVRDQYATELLDLYCMEKKKNSVQEALNTTIITAGVGVVDVSCIIGGKIPNEDDISCTRHRGILLFRSLLRRIEQEVGREEGMVIRLLVLNPPPSEMSVALPLLISTIRNKNLPVIICITMRPTTTWSCSTSSSIVAIRRTSDFVFKVDAFDSFRKPPPSEFRNLNGILHVQKITKSLNHFTTSKSVTTASRYGISRDRRKLYLKMLHLPPEDFSSSSTKGSATIRGIHPPNKGATLTTGADQYKILMDRKTLCGSSGSSSLLEF